MQVLKQLKGDPQTQSIPVVIMTSSKEERDLIEGYKSGVNSYIQKPVGFEQFRNTVKTLGMYWMVVNQPPPQNHQPSAAGDQSRGAETATELRTAEALRVVILEDNRLDAELVLHELDRAGFALDSVVLDEAETFSREIKQNRPDIVLADFHLSNWTGLDALEILRRERVDVPLILVTGSLGMRRPWSVSRRAPPTTC